MSRTTVAINNIKKELDSISGLNWIAERVEALEVIIKVFVNEINREEEEE